MSRRLMATYGFLGLCLLAYLVSEIVRPLGQSWPAVDGWGTAIFEIVASLLCIARARMTRRGWATPLVLGVGLLAWSLGDLALTIESIGGATPPTPSVADGFYLISYLLAYVGVMLLVRHQVRRLSAATWLDGAVAGVGAAAVCAEFAFRGLFSSLDGGTAAVATNLAYPVGDLLLLALVVAGTSVLPGRRRARWLLLAVGYSINAVGDTFNLFHSTIGGTRLGILFDAIAWPVSILLVSLSVWLPTDSERRAGEPAPGLALPALAATAALVILIVDSFHAGGSLASGLAAVTLILAGTRCGLALARLRAVTDERHDQAITDELTTLGNRRALFEFLDGLLTVDDSGQDTGREIAFLFVDLNRFKEVNDSFGHSVGDELLRQLGGRLKGSLRASDLLVRLGGDEFAVALLDAGADYAASVAQRIAGKLEDPFVLSNVRTRIGASIGIAVFPRDATTAPDLLRCADLAMYRAKVDGKPFAVYQQDLDGYGNRLELVEELRVAIEQRRLEVHYQPQIDLASGEIVAVEALLRWPHPRLGYVPPLEFLSLAEDADLMDPLTAVVLEKALRQCAMWRAANRSLAVSVNISATNLLNPGFAGLVQALLARYQLGPDVLVLEITETTAMVDVNRCKEAIQRLRDLGLLVSVDDFGAGFTSLAYLSTLAVGELKLDRSFINGLASATGARDLALVRSTISLAHALGLRVVAEGVEDLDSLALLADIDCDLAQGYLISKPKPADELALNRFGTFPARPGEFPAAEVA